MNRLSINGRRALVLVVSLAVCISVCAQEGDLYFAAPDGTGAACSLSEPCSLNTALQQAVDGDTIYLETGTYTGMGDQVLLLDEDLTILGGWDASTAWPPSLNCLPDVTVLDGEGARRVVYMEDFVEATLGCLTIANGAAHGEGGGILSRYGDLTLQNSTFKENTVTDGDGRNGGAIYATSGNLTVDTCLFQGNGPTEGGAFRDGGAIFVYNADEVAIENSVFKNNDAWRGGAVYANGSDMTVRNCRFQGNGDGQSGYPSAGYGGAIYGEYTAVEIQETSFLDSYASNESGALYLGQGGVNMNRCLFMGNRSVRTAALFADACSLNLYNTIFADNVPTRNDHGALRVKDGVFKMFYCTVARNRDEDGGIGVNLRNCTAQFYNNIIVGQPIGVYVEEGMHVDARKTLWGNGAWANGADWDGGGTHNSIDEFFGDPDFRSTETPDYHIGSNSAALDRASNVGVTEDIDGDTRPWGAGFDIGADEFTGLPGDCNGDGTVTIGEVQRAINMFLGVEPIDCGVDGNSDGSVSIGEVQKVINGFLGVK